MQTLTQAELSEIKFWKIFNQQYPTKLVTDWLGKLQNKSYTPIEKFEFQATVEREYKAELEVYKNYLKMNYSQKPIFMLEPSNEQN